MTDEEHADALDAAADYLRTFGWQQHQLGGRGYPACMIGAAYEVSGCINVDELTVCALQRVICSASLASWNDAPGRTADEVIDALMEAAARIRNNELGPFDP